MSRTARKDYDVGIRRDAAAIDQQIVDAILHELHFQRLTQRELARRLGVGEAILSAALRQGGGMIGNSMMARCFAELGVRARIVLEPA